MAKGSFWTDKEFQPKRNFRFQVELISGKYSLAVPYYLVSSATKPSFAVENKSYKFLNQSHNYPGTVTWNTVDITFIDTRENTALAIIQTFLSQGRLNFSQEDDGIFVRNNAIEKSGYSLKNVKIKTLDDEGKPVETWDLKDSWIKEVKFSNLDYSDEGLSTMTISLVYDWATVSLVTPEIINLEDGTIEPPVTNEPPEVTQQKQMQEAVDKAIERSEGVSSFGRVHKGTQISPNGNEVFRREAEQGPVEIPIDASTGGVVSFGEKPLVIPISREDEGSSAPTRIYGNLTRRGARFIMQ